MPGFPQSRLESPGFVHIVGPRGSPGSDLVFSLLKTRSDLAKPTMSPRPGPMSPRPGNSLCPPWPPQTAGTIHYVPSASPKPFTATHRHRFLLLVTTGPKARTSWRQTLPETGCLCAPIRPTARSLRRYPFPEPCRRGMARLVSLSVPGRSGPRHQWRRWTSSRQGWSRIDW